MKKRFLVLLSFLFSMHYCFPQTTTFETAFKPYFQVYLNKIIYNPNGGWIAVGSYDNEYGFSSPPYVVGLDSNGNVSWTYNVQLWGEAGQVTDIIKTKDDNFVIIGKASGCEVPVGVEFIQKIDPSGNLLWSQKYWPKEIKGYIPFSNVKELNNGGLLISADSSVFRASDTGDSLWSKTYNHGPIYAIEENINDQFILGCKDGILKTDSMGNLLNFYSYNAPVKSIFQEKNSSYVLLSGLNLMRIDSSFNLKNSLNLSAKLGTAQILKRRNDAYWILGNAASNSISNVLPVDTSFQINSPVSLGISSVKATDFDVSPLKVVMAGTEITPDVIYKSNTHIFIKTFELLGNSQTYSTDAGIISIKIDTVYTKRYPYSPKDIYDVYFKAHVTIRNFSIDTLKSIYINSYLNWWNPCERSHYLDQLSGLNIAHGDSLEIKLGIFEDFGMHLPQNNMIYTACLWTSVPNGKIDKDHTNDNACISFPIPLSTGITDYYPDQNISIFPNPCISRLNIESKDQLNLKNGKYELQNYLGQKILSGEIYSTNTTIDLSGYPSGIYFILLTINDKSIVRKIVKS
jgi:hypothetical protein